jgi:peptidyl-prolyl cis-trans isomerase C
MIRELLGRPGRSALIVALAFGATAALAQTPPAPAPADPNAVVATVNGINLTEREVQLALSELAPGGAGIDEQKREQLIGFLINVKLIAKAAEEQKLGEGPEFEARLAFMREQALMKSYLEKVAEGAVTEDAVKKVYEETIKEIKPEQEVHARHILLETEDEAKKALERVKAGEDFATVAKELSEDPGSGAEGGDLGFFLKEQMVPEFSEAAFKMETGKISEPVKSQYGWHIIKVEEKRERAVPKLEEVRAQIEDYVGKKAQEDAVKKLTDGAKIERAGGPAKKPEEAPAPAK